MNASADKVGTNSDIRHANAALLSITHELPPEVVTSDYFDEQLAQTYKRLRMPKGLLERLAGISTRRGWAEGQTFGTAWLPQPRRLSSRRVLTVPRLAC